MRAEPTAKCAPKPIVSQEEHMMYSHQPPRAVCTLSSLNPVSWIGCFLSALYQFFKRLICCSCFYRPPAISIPTPTSKENKLEIDPKDLPENDPFRKEVFVFDAKGNFSFKRKEGFEKAAELFTFFGMNSYWKWILNTIYILGAEKALRRIDSPPLTFLYYIFCNKTHTSHIVHFKEQAISGAWIMRIKTGRDPWEEFLGEQVKEFAKYSDILEKLPGFCKALGLDEKTAEKFAKEKKWRELVVFVFESRKKHFDL